MRLQIAGDIAQGISIDKLLDNVRDTIGSTIERIHLLTKKDIHNIERSFGLRRAEKHKNDALSPPVGRRGQKPGTKQPSFILQTARTNNSRNWHEQRIGCE